MNDVDTIELEGGLKARILRDKDCEQPFENADVARIVVLHRRYIDPSEGKCGTNPDEIAAWEKRNAKEWFSVPLWLYDHSGTAYAVGERNPFSCPWDSGRVGIVALNRESYGNADDAKMMEFAKGVADAYSEWANGNCFGFVIEDAAGVEIESCWGYVGIEAVKDGIKEAAPVTERGMTA